MHSMTDQIIDLHYTLHMKGVPLDYRTIIQQSTIPKSKLMKHWNALTIQQKQEVITLGFLK